jgi:hypothetical protein
MLEVDIVGLRDLKGRFRSMLDGELVAIQLEEAERMARSIQEVFRTHAPRGAKVSKDRPGRFFESIHGQAEASGVGFTIQVETTDPDLAKWLREGTGIYGPRGARIFPIQAKAMGPVRSWAPGAGSGPYFFASIAGMPAQRWEEAAFAEAAPLSAALGGRIGRRVTQHLTGGAGAV